MSSARGAITALLGPTNTGKTHRAVERMLEHRSGMLGVPLRLLARELYDRISARIGEREVALVTGEEKRVPRAARYFVCTVEAMPHDRDVDFVAIDEVQLAAHRERGHAFTDRLLRARGREETWLLGADTLRPVVAALVPTARVQSHPRLSQLTWIAPQPVSRLPPRSAVVAFSLRRVYELAERLRQRHGGAAVVVGALSPRARNAQVAMFQSGEVDYLVATDAIGMGLNLDVDHVAFAETDKFDGRERRSLDAAELAQIAGRAGRHLRDGTFSTLAPLPALAPGLVRAIEHHSFGAERRVWWRSADLDFASVEALAASLEARPGHPVLRLVERTEDGAALAALAADDDVRRLARGTEAVALLWEVCQIPDYRQLAPELHAADLREIYLELATRGGRVSPERMTRELARIDDPGGDLDDLLGRLAAVRFWNYVAGRDAWHDDPARWQESARAVEDRLSDALHQKLVARFVDAGKPRAQRVARARATRSSPHAAPEPSDGPFARLRELLPDLVPKDAPEDPQGDPAQVLADAPHERFTLDARGRILDGEVPIARLVRGADVTRPEVTLTLDDRIASGARSRIARRLVAYARDVVSELLEPLDALDDGASASLRGLAFDLRRGLGSAALPGSITFDAKERAALDAARVRVGHRYAWLPALLAPVAVETRVAFVNAWLGASLLTVPRAGATSFPAPQQVPRELLLVLGYPSAASRAVRVDVLDRIHAARRDPEPPTPAEVATWLGAPKRVAEAVLDALAER